MKKTYLNIRGTRDFDPKAAAFLNDITQKTRNIFKLFGFSEVVLPILEDKGVFTKGVGETTDIVERQIFQIDGKDDIVLRPEGTAQVIRYYIQNSLHKQSDFHKLSYIGPMFRGERPQKGRLRQFNHFGAEAIGSNSPLIDAEMIAMSIKILDEVGVEKITLEINSLGCTEDKKKFEDLLKKDLNNNREYLCDDCKRRMDKNPLRVLDCKSHECKKVVDGFLVCESIATDYLCSSCLEHYKDVMKALDKLKVKYTLNPKLVRGLDYYTNTVFEIIAEGLGAQSTIGAGGRYNKLVQNLGGVDTPAIGFALGVERILIALNEPTIDEKITAFIVTVDKNLINKAFDILSQLRASGIDADMDYCDKSLKAQMRIAGKKNAAFSIIVGEDELKEDSVVVKDMINSTQEKVKISDLISKFNQS